MFNVQRFRAHGTEVDAVQVYDDLGQNLAVAEWIHTNGGRLTDPMTTFDCNFKVYIDGAQVPVNIGDWVLRFVAHGSFAVWAHHKFEAAFKPVEVAP